MNAVTAVTCLLAAAVSCYLYGSDILLSLLRVSVSEASMPEPAAGPRRSPQGVPYSDLQHIVNADGLHLFCRYWEPSSPPSCTTAAFSRSPDTRSANRLVLVKPTAAVASAVASHINRSVGAVLQTELPSPPSVLVLTGLGCCCGVFLSVSMFDLKEELNFLQLLSCNMWNPPVSVILPLFFHPCNSLPVEECRKRKCPGHVTKTLP
ncbi:hypothetical protein D4764_08G0004030 [Takifugu flavidus]|uniref:Uncharacterized protein n=1 Tax=Takifugu flavidus TaxID=433684 RepID=A0A5C6MMP0_9TELE|nr:hypothetical protein D4764_08G0004030 [Takifugu flavidus]